MEWTNKIIGYLGIIIFIILDFFLGFIFISIHDDPDSILAFGDSLNPTNLTTMIILVSVLLVIQILLAFLFSLRAINSEQKFEIYPELSKDPHLNWGKFTPDEVQAILLSVAKQAGVNIRKAFISTEIIPKVFSYNFGKKPVIILNANLLQICSGEELKAAISVELGFTKSFFTSIITYLNYSIKYFLIPLYIIPFYFLGHGMILTWFNNEQFKFEPHRVITQIFFVFGLIIISFILFSRYFIPF